LLKENAIYIYGFSEEHGMRLEGFEEHNQPYVRRMAEIDTSTIYFFAERGAA